MDLRRLIGATMIAAVLLLAPAAPAIAADDPDPAPTGRAEGTYIEYTGTVARVDTDSDGVAHEQPSAVITLGIECDDAGCRLYGLDSLLAHDGEVLALTGGSGSFSFPAIGSATCSNGGDGAVRPETVAVEATAAAITVTVTQPSEGWIDCSGTQTYLWGIAYTVNAEYSAGDACVLDAAGCPTPTPTPDVTLGGAGGSPARSADAPSVLSVLPTAAESLTVPNSIWAAVGTVVLVLLIALPTHFFNSAAERVSGRLTERVTGWCVGCAAPPTPSEPRWARVG